MCNCVVSRKEINKSILELVHDQWLLENGFLFGDYIFYWCDFCGRGQLEYPNARICIQCQKTICNRCDRIKNLIYPDTSEMEEEYDYNLWWLRCLYNSL
jgi:hypothetical protein